MLFVGEYVNVPADEMAMLAVGKSAAFVLPVISKESAWPDSPAPPLMLVTKLATVIGSGVVLKRTAAGSDAITKLGSAFGGTLRMNVSLAVFVPSVTSTVIVVLIPASAAVGVPTNLAVAGANANHAGSTAGDVTEKASVVPGSGSINVSLGSVKEN